MRRKTPPRASPGTTAGNGTARAAALAAGIGAGAIVATGTGKFVTSVRSARSARYVVRAGPGLIAIVIGSMKRAASFDGNANVNATAFLSGCVNASGCVSARSW